MDSSFLYPNAARSAQVLRMGLAAWKELRRLSRDNSVVSANPSESNPQPRSGIRKLDAGLDAVLSARALRMGLAAWKEELWRLSRDDSALSANPDDSNPQPRSGIGTLDAGLDGATPDNSSETRKDPGDSAADPFAPVSGEEFGSAKEKALAEVWEPLPAPGEPPAVGEIRHAKYGVASHCWVYRDAAGAPLYAVVRFDTTAADGTSDKQILPYSFGKQEWTTKAGIQRTFTGWHFKGPTAPTPLYGLDRLAARPHARVLLCEGEKAADAAGLVFPDAVAIAAQGGSKALGNSDWPAIVGRDVTIWPDADVAGTAFAKAAAKLLQAAGAAFIRVAQISMTEWLNKWDLADDLPSDVLPTRLQELLDASVVQNTDESVEESKPGPAPNVTDPERDAEIERLSRLAKAEYAFSRKAAAQTLKIGVADLDTVVRMLQAKRRGEAEAKHRATPAPESGSTLWPLGILSREDGLHMDIGDAGPVWLCEPLEVLGEGRDAEGRSWGLWLQWRDADGRIHTWRMPAKMLKVQPGELEATLVDGGLRINGDPAARAHLRFALNRVRSGSRVLFVDTPGWCAPRGGESAFVLIDGTVIGSSAEKIVPKATSENASIRMAPAGTLEGWQQDIAAKANGNPVAAFSICAALAGPLLEPLGESSGGFHFHGHSKTGKTLAMRMAISVWGATEKAGLLKDWRTTANALEGAAEECNDGFLPLDEIHQAEPRDVVAAVYQLANESGKQRLTREAVPKRRRTWRTLILSNGEIDLATMAAKHSRAPLPAGAEVRLPSIPIDGRDMWPCLHGEPNSAALVASLQVGLRRSYGTAIRAFIAKLIEVRGPDNGSLEIAADELRATFRESLPDGADAQVQEVARRCALIALAGELATQWGILPWECGDATIAAKTILSWWIGRRGGFGSTEESQHIKAIRSYMAEYGASRFVTLDKNEVGDWRERYPDRPTVSQSGWRRPTSSGNGYEYLFDKEGWQKVCSERRVNPIEVARTLRDAGHLEVGEGRNLAKQERIPGRGQIRCYIVLPTILADGEAPQ